IAVDHGRVFVALRTLVKRVAFNAVDDLAQIIPQALSRIGVEMNENEPLPEVGHHRREAELLLVQIIKVGLVGHEAELAVETECKTMIRTGERPERAPGTVFVEAQLRATMGTHIVKTADHPIAAPNNDQ